jgi:hypothetical protein
MALPNIDKLLKEIHLHGEPEQWSDLYHAFYYHNKGWLVLPEEELHLFELCLAWRNALREDKWINNLRPIEDY